MWVKSAAKPGGLRELATLSPLYDVLAILGNLGKLARKGFAGHIYDG